MKSRNTSVDIRGFFSRLVLSKVRRFKIIRLTHLSQQLSERGRMKEAAEAAKQALSMAGQYFGESDETFADALYILANLCQDQGDFSQAEQLYLKAVRIYREAVGKENPNLGATLSGLAVLYEKMGRYAQAEQLYSEVIGFVLNDYGDMHPNYASCLNNLALLYRDMGNYLAAESLFLQAKEIRRAALSEDHPDYAQSLNDLALLYHDMGDYKSAESLFIRASDIWRASLGEKHPEYALSLNNLAVLYRAMGNYAAAEPLYKQALELYRATLGENHPDYARSVNNLALLYQVMGNYVAAESLFKRAIKVREVALGKNHPYYASSLNNLAALYRAMGNYVAAEPLYHQAIEILGAARGEGHPEFAQSLNNLALLYQVMGNYVAAESLFKRAIEISGRVLGEKHPKYALNLDNLGTLYLDMGNYAAAEPLYKQAIEIRRAALSEDHPDYAMSLNNLAALCVATDRDAEGLSLVKRAAAVDDRVVGRIFSFGSERQRMEYMATQQGKLDFFLSLVSQRLSHSQEAVRAAFDFVLRRKAIGAEALATQRDAVLAGRYPHLEAKLRELRALSMAIGQKTLAGPGHENPEAYQTRIAEWTSRKEDLEEELARHIPEMNLALKLGVANGYAVAQVLPADMALVEYVRIHMYDFKAVPARGEPKWQPDHYLAFILVAGKPDNVDLLDLGPAEPIDGLITAFRALITGGDRDIDPARTISDESSTDAASQGGRQVILADTMPIASISDGKGLRAKVFDPLLPVIAGCRCLIISPEGNLTRVPFGALPNGKGHRLIDEYSISYLAAGRDILRFDVSPPHQAASPLVMGDPDFDLTSASVRTSNSAAKKPGPRSLDLDRSGLNFARLPGTRAEGEQIAAFLGVQPWLGKLALEGRLKASPSPRILHLATHGFFLQDQKLDPNKGYIGLQTLTETIVNSWGRMSTALENPMLRSGLALAGANTWLQSKPLPPEAEDGFLTAVDVTGLDLLGTELAVLSACETGLGEIQVGEGVFGLRRAFVLAGAKTLVMSLWKVPDRQTQELMTDFYRRILNGQGRSEALRLAQLAIKEKWPNPLYWGAFICQGDPGPLPQQAAA